jgi:hypothetical protein
MSDTMQVVQWALEYTCPLRSGGASKDPAGTLREIARAHEIGRSGAHPGVGFGVMGDVYVSGYTMQPVPKSVWGSGATGVPSDKDDSVLDFLHEMHEAEGSTVIHFPCSGFIISEAFAGVGGIDGLLSLCGKCPANAGAPHPAGCAGMMYLHPHDEELQVQLAAAVDRLGLRDRVDEFFVRTNPIWFGLWVRSPLGAGACEVLDLLVGELSKRKLEWWGAESLDDLRTFQRATRISREK